jgi:hypothetical protein
LNNVLHVAISVSLKLKEKMNLPFILDNFIDDNSSLNMELGTLAMNINNEVYEVIDLFLSFLKKYDERKIHNMLSLMLNPKF